MWSCGIRKNDRVRDEVVWSLCVMKKSLDEKVEKSVSRWYGHVRMDEVRIKKKVWKDEFLGKWLHRRLKHKWIDCLGLVWMKQMDYYYIIVQHGNRLVRVEEVKGIHKLMQGSLWFMVIGGLSHEALWVPVLIFDTHWWHCLIFLLLIIIFPLFS